MIMGITETQHPHTDEQCTTTKVNKQGTLRGGKYKWYYGSGIDPKAVEELNKERDLKGKAKKEAWENAREHGGTAILIHKRLWNNVIRAEPKGSRLLKCTLKMKKKTDFIIAHAQQATKTKEEEDELYKELQTLVDENPKRHVQIIM